nr:MAG TPA: hypothetical protein [Caudoviricetes sp.]
MYFSLHTASLLARSRAGSVIKMFCANVELCAST